MENKKPLRVLHTESSVNFGGQELRILRQMRWLLNQGHQTWLLAGEKSAIFQEATTLQLPCCPLHFRGSFNPRVIRAVQRFWHQHQIDVLDCHSMRDASVAMPLSWLGYPVVHSQHICKPLKANLTHRLIWRTGSQVVLASSNSIANRLIQQQLVPPKRIHQVGEAVDLALFHPRVSGHFVRKQWGIPEHAKLVTVVGMLRPDKAPHFLIQAVDPIVKAVPDAWFMLVGAPTKAEYGEQLDVEISKIQHKERVVLAGFQREVEQYMAASDLIAMTSTIEAQSMIIPQAFASKRIVVAPNVGGIPELIESEKTGYLYPAQNVEELAKGIIHALRSDNTEIIERAYAVAKEKLSLDHQMNLTLDVYRAAMKK